MVSIQPSSIETVTKPRVTMEKRLNSGMMAVTQWKRGHENDETASVRRVRCRVASEARLKQVVAQIVTELQVTMLKHGGDVRMCILLMHSWHSAQMLFSSLCTSTNPYLYCLVVTAPLSPSKKQSSSWSSHVADLVDLHTLVAAQR